MASDGQTPGSLTRTLETTLPVPVEGGLVAGKYRIHGEIGRGGMGIIYKAEDIKLKRAVALKFLPPQWTSETDARERFVHEAQAASALDHPGVCTIYEIGETDSRQMYIAMAYYEGESLRERIKRGPLGQAEALDIIVQAARAMAKAHQRGIVHRDIKPANLLITTDGVVKIVDFGLAKLANQVKLTREGTTVGTVAYMSPEQAKGEAVDRRTDIWSLGVVLYEMLAGQLPFKGDYEQTLIFSILNHEPEPIAKLRKDVPRELGQVMSRALEKDPAPRYQNMEEFLEDLRAVGEGLAPSKARLRPGRILGIRKRPALAGLAGVVVLAVLAILLFSPKPGPSIAVLPLKNISGDPGQEFLADRIHEELITSLGEVRGWVRVMAPVSVRQFRTTDKSPREIARELNVSALVTGSVLRSGTRVSITAQLIDPATGAQAWAHPFSADLRDILSLENEIVSAITSELKVRLTPQEQTRLAKARKVDPEAYEAYLKGLSEYNKLTPSGLDSALSCFSLALEKDPEYAPAYAGIAEVWVGRQQQGLASYSETTPKAKAAALKALELDSSLWRVHNMLAGISTWVDWDWAGGEREFRRALEINPNSPDPRPGYSHLLNYLKRPEEAMAQIRRALELDPFNALTMAFYGMDLMYARRYDDAIAQFQAALKMSPQDREVNSVALSNLRSAYHMKRMYPEALEVFKELYASKGDREAEDALARGFETSGYPGALQSVAEALVARSKTSYVTPWQIATLYTRAGKKNEALEWLEKAYEAHDQNMPYISVDPIFDDLRPDPRFQDLLRRMKLL